MLLRFLKIPLIIFLILLPFLAGDLIGKFSPYYEGNSMGRFVVIYLALTLVMAILLLFIMNRLKQPFSSTLILFFLGYVLIGITGLAAPPDLSIKMLEHPEREHVRYILLFIGALLFGLYFVFQLKDNTFEIKNPLKGVITVLFVLAFTEMIWEFSHHYLYPEGLKKWTDEGKKADDFVKSYDNFTIVVIGATGRFMQFVLIAWLSIRLYKLRKVRIWSVLLTSVLSFMGVLSAILIVVTEMHFPKGLEFLFLFFIPGIPFLLLYLIGVALLTAKPSSN